MCTVRMPKITTSPPLKLEVSHWHSRRHSALSSSGSVVNQPARAGAGGGRVCMCVCGVSTEFVATGQRTEGYVSTVMRKGLRDKDKRAAASRYRSRPGRLTALLPVPFRPSRSTSMLPSADGRTTQNCENQTTASWMLDTSVRLARCSLSSVRVTYMYPGTAPNWPRGASLSEPPARPARTACRQTGSST
jgi:hypothetical protein